jgi:SPP1 family phage portal protein
MVDWKTGYVFGNPIKYAQSKSVDTDDIHYLNKYVRNVCQRSVDKEVGKWAYATGVGYYFVEPKSEDFDIETEAPYEIYCRASDTCTKVYSSFGANKPLCDILYTTYKEVSGDFGKKTVKVLDIYTTDYLYTYEKRDLNKWIRTNSQKRGLYRKLPLVEKRFNTDGIGIVAMGETMQNSLDKLISNGLDNVEDVVNEIFVYKNVLLGKTPEEMAQNHRTMRKNGAININTPSGASAAADVDTLSPKMSLSEIREMFTLINSIFHSTVGVPIEVSNTNSGGTTKQGSEVANGYDSAYDRAIDDINTFIKADTELLEKIMWICKNSVGNKINNLATSEIEIKYSLNLTDNMLTKSQSYGTFIQTMPPSMALRMCRLSNDPEAEGKLIEQYMQQQEDKQTQQTVTTSQE